MSARTYAPRNATYTGGNRISPSAAPAWATHPASSKALDYLDSLIEGRDTSALPAADIDVLDVVMDRMDSKPISGRECSRAIDVLKTLPRTAAVPAVTAPGAPAAPAAGPVTQDGMYLRPDGVIFKVQVAVHGSGNLYAKQLRLVPVGERRMVRGKERAAEFDYAPGAMQTLTADMRMTLEQAREWGALYSTCVRCGLTLTAEESIERSMGPICATKI